MFTWKEDALEMLRGVNFAAFINREDFISPDEEGIEEEEEEEAEEELPTEAATDATGLLHPSGSHSFGSGRLPAALVADEEEEEVEEKEADSGTFLPM